MVNLRENERAAPSSRDDARQDVVHARRAAAGLGSPPRRRRPNPFQRFGRRFGWRAYALPILAGITVVALLNLGDSGGSSNNANTPQTLPQPTTSSASAASVAPSTPPVASGSNSLKSDQPGSNALENVLASGALPAGAKFSTKGDGTFRVIAGTSGPVGAGEAKTYSVDVENGISGVDVKQFAAQVQTVLSDAQSWAGHGDVTLTRVDSPGADFHVTLTSVNTDHALCGQSIPVETSCYVTQGDSGVDANRVVMNVARWVRGSTAYIGDLASYRIYMINHEVGHAIGHQHAHQCLPGGQAPVMMQQTIGLKSAETAQMCTANPWPYPPGVKGAPGAEQPDTEANSEYVLNSD